MLLLAAVVFLAGVVLAALAGLLPVPVAAGYVALSLLLFTIYAIDKAAARRQRRRVRERTLHLLALAGGWPGALAAQALVRHKSRKVSFLVVFWLTVLLNLSALVLWLAASSHGFPRGWA